MAASRAGAAAAEQWVAAVAARDATAASAAAAAAAVAKSAATSRRAPVRLPAAPPPPAAPLRVRIGSAATPHPEKASTGGEDASCVRAAANIVAVADGVGGWADEGVDPALVRALRQPSNHAVLTCAAPQTSNSTLGTSFAPRPTPPPPAPPR
jgi:hypothetical protein